MPTYVYRCKTCSIQVELVQKITERKNPLCEKCKSEMETVIQPVGFVLAGSGWAKDGYK